MFAIRHPSFFHSDPEYPDLDCRELAAERYLRLLNSADYRKNRFIDDDPDREGVPLPSNNLPLPHNVITIGRRITPSLRIKIFGALEIVQSSELFSSQAQFRVYELFFQVKKLGFRYDYKHNMWEFQVKWKSGVLTKKA